MKLLSRRLLALSFVLAFLVGAPLLIFYAVGYRYQWGKNNVVQTGTIVFSTIPRGATIILNGSPLDQKTPATLTGLTPGDYAIRLEKDGYLSWQKRLPLEGDRAVFVSSIRLFSKDNPTQSQQGDWRLLGASPTNAQALYVVTRDRKDEFILLDTNTRAEISLPAVTDDLNDSIVQWAPSEQQVSLLTKSHAWLLAFDTGRVIDLNQSARTVLRAIHWGDNTLTPIIATDGSSLASIDPLNFSVQLAKPSPPLADGEIITDAWSDGSSIFTLRKSTDGPSSFVNTAAQNQTTTRSSLPSAKAYRLIATIDDILVLMNESRVLGVYRRSASSLTPILGAEGVQHIDVDRAHRDIIFATTFEIWTYNVATAERVLLTRLATPVLAIRSLTAEASHVFYTTIDGLFAIERDGRDVRNVWKLIDGSDLGNAVVSGDGSKLWLVGQTQKSAGLFQRGL